jgi:hypothetical protein
MNFLIEEVHDDAFRFNAVALLRSDIPPSLRARIVKLLRSLRFDSKKPFPPSE